MTLAVIAIVVTPTPRALAFNFNSYKFCEAHLLVYGTQGQEVTLDDRSKWDTDRWTIDARTQFRVTRTPLREYSKWESASAFARGCHAFVGYRWPGGSAEFSMTLPYDGRESVSCDFVGDARYCDEEARMIGEPDLERKYLTVYWRLVLP